MTKESEWEKFLTRITIDNGYQLNYHVKHYITRKTEQELKLSNKLPRHIKDELIQAHNKIFGTKFPDSTTPNYHPID